MKLRASRSFFHIAVVALVASCAPDTSPEQQVRDVIAHGEELVEARDVSGVASLVSEDYSDARGYDKRELAIDLINGSALLREWVDDSAATVADLDALAEPDERAWLAERDQFLLYR